MTEEISIPFFQPVLCQEQQQLVPECSAQQGALQLRELKQQSLQAAKT